MLDEDRLMLDRSPDEIGSHGNDMDDSCGSDSDLDDDDTETTHDGVRKIYPWMKKIHVAGVGEYNINTTHIFCILLMTKQISACEK